MKAKSIVLTLSALMVGVVIGGVALNYAKADETTNDTQTLTQEQVRERHQEMMELHDNIDRVVTKTDEGIQINLNGEDQTTIDQMHTIYDENGGTWGFGPREGMGKGMGMGRMMNGEGFVDEDGNGVCDHAE